MDYFDRERMRENHYSWYEGSNLFAPSTNNGCEGFNSYIKKYFNQKRVGMSIFVNKIVELFKQASIKHVAIRPKYESSWFELSEKCSFIKDHVLANGMREFWFDNYCVPSENLTGDAVFDPACVNTKMIFTASRTTEFRALYNRFAFVTVGSSIKSFKDIFCTCLTFVKKRGCSDVFFVLKRIKLLNLVDLPLTAPKKKRQAKERNTDQCCWI